MPPSGFAIATSRRLPVPILLLGTTLAGIPAPSAGSTPVYQEAADTLDHVAGTVRSADSGTPLAGAMVEVVSTGGTAVTHGDGSFRIAVPDAERHRLRIDRLGYAAVAVDVQPGEPATVDLEVAAIPLPDVVVTAVLSPTSANEMIRPSAVFAHEKLQRHLAGTLAQTVESVPGVAVTSMGPGTSQPVIRGLGGDRILMLEDGQRVGDVVNSGADHATAVTPSSARRIDVIRGPSAILYGSNALGGVINVVREEVPRAVPDRATGFTSLQTQTVTRAIGGSGQMTVEITEHIPLRVEASRHQGGDLRTPIGRLAGTQTDTWSVAAGTSWVDDWGYAGGAFRFYANNYGIPGGFLGGHTTPVRTEQERAAGRLRSVIRPGRGFEAIELDAGYTWYRHHEWEPPSILGTLFERQIASGEARARHAAWGPFASGAVGARVSWEHFGFGGALYSPNTRRRTQAAYALEEIRLDPVLIEAGLRYDRVDLEPNREELSDIGHIRARSFDAVSGSLGALLRVTGQFTLGASVARAFRTPDVHELYSEGPHLAANSFDVGNPSLGTETGLGIDVFGRLTRQRLSAELTWFRNTIVGYIFPQATGKLSRILLPIYQYVGEDALLTGFESLVGWSMPAGFKLEAAASYVHGTIRATDAPLPFMPPLQGRLAVGYSPVDWFVEAEARMAGSQERTGRFEQTTDGYAVLGLSGGVRLTVAGRLHVVTLHLENLGDTVYRNHLSRVKEIMPEAGRGLGVTYRVVF
ncbi:MAG: TonB-dependent receptor [Gemmatimonadetes bacterium]|nr:TonB-dependent receptor [Gemmatimonadota bacterium]MYJ40481.1 TonB-dependent receptor [Gemmatimonadota bacterium]